MLNKLLSFLREMDMVRPGDRVICAVSGGADSVALLFALYLLRQRLEIKLEAAHFNHHLRGAESDRDERFVRQLCGQYEIPLHVGQGRIVPGEKGLEAAAREARYRFFDTLPGKIATAHTADDNAETVLLHLVRGTGLKGLGGIAPVRGKLIRPMLEITRREVEAFLEEWHLDHVEDSSNGGDAFLRNRLRHHVMPLLKKENPQIGLRLSQMALRLREDAAFLEDQCAFEALPEVPVLRSMPKAQRTRVLENFLKRSGVREPEKAHLALAESLVFSKNPSARASFPGGVTLARSYDRLEVREDQPPPSWVPLPCPGEARFGAYRAVCGPAEELKNTAYSFTVRPVGQIVLRPRQPGDELSRPGGTKSVKKLLIDQKIPLCQRQGLPVACDEGGILGVCSLGVHQKRAAKELPAVTIRFEKI